MEFSLRIYDMSLFQWTPYEREGVNGWSMESIVEGLAFRSFLSARSTKIYPISHVGALRECFTITPF